MTLPENIEATPPVNLIRCKAGHYHLPGPCPICHGTREMRAVAITMPRQPMFWHRMSWLMRFNLIAASLAIAALAVVWVMIFHQPPAAPPAQTASRAETVIPVQTATAVPPPAAPQAAAPQAATPPAPGTATAPDTAPATATPAPEQPQTALAVPLPLPRPVVPPADAQATAPQPQIADGSAVPFQVPQPGGGASSPPNSPYPWPGRPPNVTQPQQPLRSSLPPAQRLGVPPSTIQQVRWLDGRTIEILVRALDLQPDETPVVEERPSGDVVRARLRGRPGDSPSHCRYMEIYPAQRSNAFLLLRFCPDGMGRWMGQDMSGY